METTVIEEQPIFTLRYSDYNTTSTHMEIYPSDLKNHEVGHEFAISPDSNCGRDIHDEILKIVYKDENGVACVHRKFGTSDDMSPTPWELKPQLIWFELK